MLVEDAFRGVGAVRELEGRIVDVGSGNGSPGIPLAASLPEREVTLLESNLRKCAFLERVVGDFPNVRVVCGRAEEQETDVFGVATAKALASPPVALEWVLPLVRPVVRPCSGSARRRSRTAREGLRPALWRPSETRDGLVVVPKIGPTPGGFPRRPGVARKRPLA